MKNARTAVITVTLIVAAEAVGYGLTRRTGWVSWSGWSWQGWIALTGVATFLAVVAALVIAVWSDEVRMLGRSPILDLTMDPVADHFQHFQHQSGSTSEYDVRISVINGGRIGAKNVELVATELAVEQPDGTFERDPVFMAMNLRRTHYGDTITPVVHRGVPRPYDLLACYDPLLQATWNRKEVMFDLSTLVSPVAAQPVVLAPIAVSSAFPSTKPKGKYRLNVAAVADGVAPVNRQVEISWTGSWSAHAGDFFTNQLQVRLV